MQDRNKRFRLLIDKIKLFIKIFLKGVKKSENKENENIYKFYPLTANSTIKLSDVTNDALKYAVNRKTKVTNVAITGNYGAGKSSIVESFEVKCKNIKFIHISLGQYEEINSSEKKGLNSREINTIEGKIINQLLHQIEPNKIGKSIFKTLEAKSRIKPICFTIYSGLILILSVYLFNNSMWNELVKDVSFLSFTMERRMHFFAFCFLFILILIGIFYLLKLQRDFGFIKKLSLKANQMETDIEIFSNENSRVSYFDRYLDDVLYLFKQSKADVIVFEDIERFNDSKIFEKLKELNIVINRKRKVHQESKLVFFYLVKDDLFESQERTKFFDYIIPVVPVVTTSNSHEILRKKLTDMGVYDSFDKTFLFNISLYLDDMRLINNVCNEYLTYKETLNTLQLENEKLFSMVVYKNIFPKDFSLLQKNQGYLFELLNSKETKLEKRKNEIKGKIKSLEETISKATEEQLNDEVELYGTILKIPNGKEVIKVNGKSQSQFTSYSEFIKELLNKDSKIIVFETFYSAYNNYNPQEVIIDYIFPEKNNPEFQERIKNAKNKKLIEKLEEDVKKNNEELDALESKRLAELYQSAADIDDFKSDFREEIRENLHFSIISFLVRNAYIDESYQDYLTYFYPNTITVVEKEYLRNVISGRTNDPGIILYNMNEIIERLGINDFRYQYVLNYSLFKYLLLSSDSDGYKNRLELLFHQEGFIKFIMDFYYKIYNDNKNGLINDLESDKIYQSLFETWISYNSNSFNEYLETDSKDFFPLKNNVVIKFLNLVETIFIENLSQRTKYLLTNYIDINFDILTGEFKYNLPRLTDNLKALNIKFTNFSTYGNEQQRIEEDIVLIVDTIFNNNLYIINENNIRFFVNWYSGYTDEQFKHQNFEIVRSDSRFKNLFDYCISSDEEFLNYILMYIALSEGEMYDEPQYIEQLLNNNVIFNYPLPQEKLENGESEDQNNDENNKKVTLAEKVIASIPDFYITYTQNKFNDLSNENRELLVQNLVHNKKAVINTDIVLDYFTQEGKEVDSLVDFINQNENFELDKEIYVKLDKELQGEFTNFVLRQKNINKNVRIRLLNEIGYPYFKKMDEVGMDAERMLFFIGYELIEFNEENLEFIRQKYPEHLAYFIKMNKFDYLKTAKDIRDEKAMKELLEDPELTEIYKVEILEFLLDNHFNQDDFEYLLTKDTYENVENETQSKIQYLVKKYIKQFIEFDEEGVSYSLYESILNANDVSVEHKQKLLKKLISDSDSQIEVDKLTFLGNYLDLLELPDIMKILKEQIDDGIYDEWEVAFEKLNQNEGNGGKGNQDVKVSFSEFNMELLDYLKKRELISDKSRYEDSVLKLYGFRTKQIEFKDSLGENNE